MADEYADPDVVRQFARAITSDVIDDTAINLVSTNIVNPVIDAELAGLGAPWTDPIPAYIQAAASLMAVGVIFDDVYYQTGQESDWGKRKWDRGMAMLQRVKSGEASVEGVSSPSIVSVSDPAANKAATAVFGGDETDWTARTETKASS